MKELLPLGTIVTLKNGTKKIMIVGRLQKQKENGKVYDYAACLWPEGMIDSQHFYLFDHEQIHILYYIGMQSSEEFQFRFVLEDEMKKLKEEGRY